MPWEHCGETLLDDLRACPRCGAAKRSHTVAFGRTRRLAIGRQERVDPEAQAAALAAAHESAAAFCERCAPPGGGEDQASEWEGDAAAQAAALEAAHANAAALCET